MKHSEMMAMTAMIFLARALPKGVAMLFAIVISVLSTYLSFNGN
jgi:hypothetical protein